jgi:hypothetical protein
MVSYRYNKKMLDVLGNVKYDQNLTLQSFPTIHTSVSKSCDVASKPVYKLFEPMRSYHRTIWTNRNPPCK